MLRQFELVERVKSYDPGADEDAINRAYVYAMRMHGSQKRASGDPYFSHPIEVAGILTDYRLDDSSIITALLHDILEDTDATYEDMEKLFGPEVAKLVNGVTKLTQLELRNTETKQAENFRKFLLAMSDDIRVLLVKLADRLHNMRTLHFIKKEDKRRRIAAETMEIYAPLAERLGMRELQSELEDLAFAELQPEARASIISRLSFLEEQGGAQVATAMDELDALLRAAGIEGYVSGREKSAYSIWRKMQAKNVAFEQLSDIMAFRCIVKDTDSCYLALGKIHAKYHMVPGRFKDYISMPKPNGYRSLHTSVIGPGRTRVEIQIRTQQMHDVAEFGVAAHWRYKEDGSGTPVIDGRQYRWLRELLEIMEHAHTPEEFLEHTKLAMYQDKVFAFSPKGDLIALPRGATPVDFAYAVHTEVGERCVGAKVNGRLVSLRTQLENGDQVEIVTSAGQTPEPRWEEFVVTGKARAHIRRHLRQEGRAQFIELGREILSKAARMAELEISDKGLAAAASSLGRSHMDDLLNDLGTGYLKVREVLRIMYPGIKNLPGLEPAETPGVDKNRAAPAASGHAERAVAVRGLKPGLAVHLGQCCYPVPGDRIVGIMEPGKGVEIHTIDCDTLKYHADDDRWLDLSWEPDTSGATHPARLHLVLADEPGSLGTVATNIGRFGGNITNIRTLGRSPHFTEVLLDMEVEDIRHLTNIIAGLRVLTVVNSVDRVGH